MDQPRGTAGPNFELGFVPVGQRLIVLPGEVWLGQGAERGKGTRTPGVPLLGLAGKAPAGFDLDFLGFFFPHFGSLEEEGTADFPAALLPRLRGKPSPSPELAARPLGMHFWPVQQRRELSPLSSNLFGHLPALFCSPSLLQ